MVVDTTKESVCINQIVGQKKENNVIEGDMIVPDIKPDILNTIEANGNICIYRKEVQDGKVRIDGTIQIDIIYLADNEEGSIRGLHTSLDFSQTIAIENCKAGMNLNQSVGIDSIETKVLNGRKINIKANVSFLVKIYSNENMDVIKELNAGEDIQKLNHPTEVNSLVGEGTTKVFAKETISIDEIDNLAEVLKTTIRLQSKDTKISYNKVLVKADAFIHILYLTEDNRINSAESLIPVMGFVDIQNVSDEHLCDTNYELRNVLIKPNSESEHSIYFEAEIEITCQVFERKNMTIIEDLYSPVDLISFTKKEILTMSNKNILKDVCSIKEKIAIPEIIGGKIYDTYVKPTITTQNTLNNRVIYEGEAKIRILYWSERENRLDIKQMVLPFQFTTEVANAETQTNIDTEMEVIKQDFVIMPDGFMDIRIDIEFLINISNFKILSVIDTINKEEKQNEDTYSMVIYFVKSGDTLWKIAKQFGSTVEDIVRVNGIENPDVLQEGKQLFIPRYNDRKTA